TLTFGRTNGVETTGSTTFNLSSSNNYIGFRFLDETDNVVKFGWAQLSLDATFQGQPRSIIGYAYENSGGSIVVGATAVPEPSSMAWLSRGGAGVAAYRRRRAAVAAA